MFTWICPQCGREVPPSYDECPDCAARQKQQAEGVAAPPPPETAAPPPAAPQYVPAAPPQPAAYIPPQAPPPPHAPKQYGGLPTWLMSIVFSLAFIGLGLGAYLLYDHFKNRPTTAGAAAPLENVGRGNAKPHPLQKYVEVTGIRFVQDPKKKDEVRFLVVNHSGAEITDLAGTVTIWGRTAKSEEESVGNFAFKIGSIGPYESREQSAPLNSKLRIYELPDWQNVTDEVQITSPAMQ